MLAALDWRHGRHKRNSSIYILSGISTPNVSDFYRLFKTQLALNPFVFIQCYTLNLPKLMVFRKSVFPVTR